MKKMFAHFSILALLVLLAGCGTALNSAVRKGDINTVKALLDQGAGMKLPSSVLHH